MSDVPGTEAEIVHLDQDNPWPGPDSFLEEQAAYFCGRNEEVEQLLRMVHAESLTVLYGLSGLGKTSLLQAGLFPLLRREGFLPVLIRLRYQETAEDPTQQIKDALQKACEASAIEAPVPQKDETLWEYFDPQRPRLLNRRGRPIVPVLIFDQFEELFTIGRETDANEERYQRFVVELANLIENRKPASVATREREQRETLPRSAFSDAPRSCRVIISLRADYLDMLESCLAQQIPTLALLRQRFGLLRMNGEQAHKAILEAGGHLVPPHVAERIVRVVAANLGTEGDKVPLAKLRVEPAILSIFCRELNERRKNQHLRIITEDLVSGTREEILELFYERAFEVVPEHCRSKVRAFVEDRLLTKSGFRNNILVDEAIDGTGLDHQIVNRLVGTKLLRIEDMGEGRRSLEITHDVLAGVARVSRDRRKEREAEEETARTKREAGEAKRRNFTRLLFMGGATAMALGLAAFSLLSWKGEQTAEDKNHKILVTNATSRAASGESPVSVLPWLSEIVRIYPSSRAATVSLVSTLLQHSYPLPKSPVVSFGGGVSASSLTFDGRWLVLGGGLGQAKVYDLMNFPAQGPVSLQQPHHAEISAIAVSSQSHAVATLSSDGELKVWSLDTGKDLRAKIQLHAFAPTVPRTLAFSQDGKFLFTSDADKLDSTQVPESGFYKLVKIDPFSDAAPTSLDSLSKIDGFAPYPDSGDHRVIVYGADPGSSGMLEIVDGDTMKATDITSKIDEGDGKSSRFLVQAAVLNTGVEIFTLKQTDASMNATCVERWDGADGTSLGRELDGVVAGRLMLSPDGEWEAEICPRQGSGGVATVATFNVTSQDHPITTPAFPGNYDLASFSPDSKLFCMGSRAGTVRIWSLATGSPVEVCESLDLGAEPAHLSFLPDSETLAVVTKSGRINLWDIRPRSAHPFIIKHESAVRFASFLDNGDYLTIDGGGVAKITPAHHGQAITAQLDIGAMGVQTAAICEQAGLVMVVSRDVGGLSACLWNMKTGKVGKAVPLDHEGDTGDLMRDDARILMDTAGAWVLTLSGRFDARLWHIHPDDATLEPDPVFEKQALQGYAVGRAGPDLLVLGKDGNEYRWNLNAGSWDGHPQVHSGKIDDAQFSRDGSEVAVISDTQLDVCSTATGICREQSDFTSDPNETLFALSPDGKRLATASHSVLRLWDVDQSKFVMEPRLLAGSEICLEFSDDGSEVLVGGKVADSQDSAAGSGFVQVWETAEGMALTHPITCDSAVRCASFNKDGTQLITGSKSGIAGVWLLAPTDSIAKNHPLCGLVEAIAGNSINEFGVIQPLNPNEDRFQRITDLRQRLTKLSLNGDPYANIGLWLTEPDLTNHDRPPTDPPPSP